MLSSIKENGNVLQSANTTIRLKTLSNTLSLHSDDIFRPNNLKEIQIWILLTFFIISIISNHESD